MRPSLFVRSSVVATLALTALPSALAQTSQISPNMFFTDTELANDWLLRRFTQDKAGKIVIQCLAFKMKESEVGLHFGVDKATRTFTYGFMGYASGVTSGPVKVKVWYDNNKKGALSADARIVIYPDTSDWLSLSETTNEPGSEDLLANSKKITFSYSAGKKPQTASFPLTGANGALKKLFECVGK